MEQFKYTNNIKSQAIQALESKRPLVTLMAIHACLSHATFLFWVVGDGAVISFAWRLRIDEAWISIDYGKQQGYGRFSSIRDEQLYVEVGEMFVSSLHVAPGMFNGIYVWAVVARSWSRPVRNLVVSRGRPVWALLSLLIWCPLRSTISLKVFLHTGYLFGTQFRKFPLQFELLSGRGHLGVNV